MTEQEIVEAWKTNEKAYMYIPTEMRTWAKSNCHWTGFKYASMVSGVFENKMCDGFDEGRVYRLREDYVLPKTPVYEYVKIVQKGWALSGTDHRKLYWLEGWNLTAIDAPAIVGFQGYTVEPSMACAELSSFTPKCKYVKLLME